MQVYTIAAVMFVSVFAITTALPARMSYMQHTSNFNSRPQRLIYLQYVQEPSPSKTHARLTHSRLTNAAAAFVAGDLKDSSVEQQIAEETIADAYPSSSELQGAQDDLDSEVAGASEIAESEVPETPEETPVLEEEIPEDIPESPVESDPEPSVAEPEEAENDDDEDEDTDVAPDNVSRANAAPLPVGSFFPISFGGVVRGATAVANSFSTGVSGTAKSQAIAYGSGPASRSKSGPIRRRH